MNSVILVDVVYLCIISSFAFLPFDCLSAYLNDHPTDLLTVPDCRTVVYLSVFM